MGNDSAYADLEIRILELTPQGYPVEMTLNGEQEFPRGYLAPEITGWVASATPDEDGRGLFDRLFATRELHAAWAEARGLAPQRRIRLRIDAAAPELHALPWELLCDGDAGDAQDLAAAAATPFSRYLAGQWQPGNPILQRPIRVLVAIANPANLAEFSLPALDVATEWAALQEATAGMDVELIQLPQPCTLSAIEAALKQGGHVLHLVAHGQTSARQGTSVLFLADEQNQAARVDSAEFAGMLARQLGDPTLHNDARLRLVFLAACQTATRSPAGAFRGMAPGLVQAGTPAVIAMQDLVPVETARRFARVFYERLLQHGQVDLACNEARAALITARLPGPAIPVLFMRLRSGLLLGRRGHIMSDHEEIFWPFLLENINRGQCIPFLGPRVNAGLLPSQATLAERLADKYGYPLPDRQNLVRVAQYIAITDPELLRSEYVRLLQRSLFTALDVQPTEEQKRRLRNAGLAETVHELGWAERVLTLHENEIHHLLADLELPLYVTTNLDNFMAEALCGRGKEVRQVGPRWERPEPGTPQFVLTPEPSLEQPVVFHLNGLEEDPNHPLVLSEDDYVAHLVRLCRDQEYLLPMNVLRMLSAHSCLFLGYQLDDWEFRAVLQGLMRPIASTNRAKKIHVGVQLDPDQVASADKTREYLGRYLGQFNIDIYWGTAQQFVSDLHTRWQDYLEESDDAWQR